jgi:hypothetical protein
MEQGLLYSYHGVDARSYFTYRLFDTRLSWADKTSYLPSDKSKGIQALFALHTPQKYWDLYRNKLTFSVIFSPLPMAPVVAVFKPYHDILAQVEAMAEEPVQRMIAAWKRYIDPSQVPALTSVATLDEWMRTTPDVELALKPVYGSHGKKVLVFAKRAEDDPGTFLTLNGDRYNAARLSALAGNAPMMFQKRIRQHHAITELLGETLCCVRVVTMIPLDGQARILGAVFKVQASAVGVDHLIYGAVGSWVDLETGRLNKGRTRYSLDYTWQIPGSDRSFEGFHLPCWEEVKSMALLAAESLPDARSVGWDIGISETGPVFVEGNDYWSVELLQMPAPHGLMRGDFKALCDELKRQDAAKKAQAALSVPDKK